MIVVIKDANGKAVKEIKVESITNGILRNYPTGYTAEEVVRT